GENVRKVVELDGDARDPFRVDSPGLLPHLRRPQLAAAWFGDPEAKDVLRVILNHVPAGRPDRQRELERRLIDVADVGRHVKELARDVCDLDRVLDLEPSRLRHRRRRDDDAQRPGETPRQWAHDRAPRTTDARQSSAPALANRAELSADGWEQV